MDATVVVTKRKSEPVYALNPLENHASELSRNLAMLDAVIESTADGIVVYALDGHIVKLNSNYSDLIGIDKYDAYLIELEEHIERLNQISSNAKSFLKRFERHLYSHRTDKGFILKMNDHHYYQITNSPYLINGSLLGRVIAFHDITLQKQTELELIEREALYKDLSVRDNLTGIYNRRKLLTAIKNCFSNPNESAIGSALIFFDLDHFKEINDVYGHTMGDLVLKRMTESVAACLRKKDIFGRWGGDEFMIILPEADRLKAEKIMRRIRARISNLNLPVHIPITCSFGIATTTEESCPEALIHRADMAMYQIKQCGKQIL